MRKAILLILLLPALVAATVVDPYTTKEIQGDNVILETAKEMRFFHNGTGWESIDSDIVPGGEFDYQNKLNKWDSYFKRYQDVNDPLKVVNNGHWVTIQATSVAIEYLEGGSDTVGIPNHRAATVEDNTITFEGVYTEGIDVKYVVQPGMVKYEIVIDSIDDVPAPMYPDLCLYNRTWDMLINFRMKLDSGQDIFVNGEYWDERDEVATDQPIEIKDSVTGATSFLVSPLVAYGAVYGENGNLSIRKQGQTYHLAQRLRDTVFRVPDNYPLLIDPTITMNESVIRQFLKSKTCTQVGACCNFPGGGTCTPSHSCAWQNPPLDIGIEPYINGTCGICSVFSRPGTCCYPQSDSNVGVVYEIGFELDDYINVSDWDDVVINDATYNLWLYNVFAPTSDKLVYVEQVYFANDSYNLCNGIPVSPHTSNYCDDIMQNQTANGSNYKMELNYTFSDCVQYWIDQDLTRALYFEVRSDNTGSAVYRYDNSSLVINYSLPAPEPEEEEPDLPGRNRENPRKVFAYIFFAVLGLGGLFLILLMEDDRRRKR